MEQQFSERVRRTAEEIASRLNEMARDAGERFQEMREVQHFNGLIRERQREHDRCLKTIGELVVRMFDRDTFAPELLRPEYERIGTLKAEIAELEQQRDAVGKAREGQQTEEAATATTGETPEEPEAPTPPEPPAAPEEPTTPETPTAQTVSETPVTGAENRPVE